MATAHTDEPIRAVGEWVRADLRGYRRPWPPRRERIPIHLAAVGPVMIRTAGELGDGWLGHELSSPAWLRERVTPHLEVGLRRAGRDPAALERVAAACCVPHPDRAEARRIAAGTVAFYATVRTYLDVFAFHGFAAEARTIQDRFLGGDVTGMLDAVPDAMVDALTITGPPDEARARIAAHDGLADAIKLAPPQRFVDPEVTRDVQRRLLELLAA